MNYYINPASFSSVFTVPSQVADRHLKFAKAEHIKILLYILKNMSEEITDEQTAENCGVSEYEVKEALLYWADAGILVPKEAPAQLKETSPKTVTQDIKPSRTDVARRGAEDPKIRFLLRETQIKLGRNLKTNETKTLVWLYDDEGLDVSLILLIVQYAAQHGKANIRFIESVAVDWINKGIDNMTDADEELRRMAIGEQAWRVVSSAFGIEKRKPSKKETEASVLWVDEWGISKEMLTAAYETCVDAKSKFSFAYASKIIESWHQKGYKTPADIEKKATEERKSSGAYNLDLFEEMLNSKD